MAAAKKNRQPTKPRDTTGKTQPPGHRYQHKERVFEEGQDAHNDPRPRPKNLSGTPLGSDPRE